MQIYGPNNNDNSDFFLKLHGMADSMAIEVTKNANFEKLRADGHHFLTILYLREK